MKSRLQLVMAELSRLCVCKSRVSCCGVVSWDVRVRYILGRLRGRRGWQAHVGGPFAAHLAQLS